MNSPFNLNSAASAVELASQRAAPSDALPAAGDRVWDSEEEEPDRMGDEGLAALINDAMGKFGAGNGFSAEMAKLIRESLETRDAADRTPLIRWALSCFGRHANFNFVPCGLQLLQWGADINAQDWRGNNTLHVLCEQQQLNTLVALGQLGWLLGCDFTALNAAGETALQVAQRKQRRLTSQLAALRASQHIPKLADLNVGGVFGDLTSAGHLIAWLQAHWRQWQLHTRPFLQMRLEEAGLIPELAKLTMQYVDGSSEFKEGNTSSSSGSSK